MDWTGIALAVGYGAGLASTVGFWAGVGVGVIAAVVTRHLLRWSAAGA